MFKKPTVKEIAEYCQSRRNTVDAELFFDHYESNGWMVGRTKMKDWYAAVRTWERQGAKFNGINGKKAPKTNDEWLKIGQEKGIHAKVGESFPQYINRLRQLI